MIITEDLVKVLPESKVFVLTLPYEQLRVHAMTAAEAKRLSVKFYSTHEQAVRSYVDVEPKLSISEIDSLFANKAYILPFINTIRNHIRKK